MKKLIIVCTIMVMVVTMAMPCFASGHTLPPLPDAKYTHWVITYGCWTDGEYLATNFDSVGGYNNTYYTVNNNVNYRLLDGEWVASDSYSITKRSVIYDTTSQTDAGTEYVTFLLPPKTLLEEIQSVLERMQVQFSLVIVVQFLIVVVTAVVGMVFMWWGVRKLTRAVFAAFRKGKISV